MLTKISSNNELLIDIKGMSATNIKETIISILSQYPNYGTYAFIMCGIEAEEFAKNSSSKVYFIKKIRKNFLQTCLFHV